jgi:hypothetical protein
MNFDLSNFFKIIFEIQCEIHNFFNYIFLYKKLVEISKIEIICFSVTMLFVAMCWPNRLKT